MCSKQCKIDVFVGGHVNEESLKRQYACACIIAEPYIAETEDLFIRSCPFSLRQNINAFSGHLALDRPHMVHKEDEFR